MTKEGGARRGPASTRQFDTADGEKTFLCPAIDSDSVTGSRLVSISVPPWPDRRQRTRDPFYLELVPLTEPSTLDHLPVTRQSVKLRFVLATPIAMIAKWTRPSA